tara:strand:- start:231 stop:713 length:483 start_codon:yes stop_codon:yes gene_type:complete
MSALYPSVLKKAGKFTALVDILFATIGIFVIVFALQELDPHSNLLPSPYDKVLVCSDDRSLRLYQRTAPDPIIFTQLDFTEDLQENLKQGGRILVALSKECMIDTGNGVVVWDRLRDIERKLTERTSGQASRMLLIEFAPLAANEEAALISRFNSFADGR